MKWLIDVALFTGFVAAFFPDVTGVEHHQRIGIIGGALAINHLASHWPWVGAVVRRFFGRTSDMSRLYLLVDAVIMLGFLAMIGTGLVISTWLGVTLSNPGGWLTVHILASIGTLVMVVLKIAMHWRWIATVGWKVLEPTPSVPAVATPRGALSGREFLGVVGLAGVAAAMALASGASGLMGGQQAETPVALDGSSSASSVSATGAASTTGSSPSSNSNRGVTRSIDQLLVRSAQTEGAASAACSVACGRRGSYPGHCRRYTGANGNGLCDWGECA